MTPAASSLTTAILALYYLILGVLAVYGVHRLILVVVWWRERRRPIAMPPEPAEWPMVTVQLPLYNEMYVAERLIDAVARLDYPRDRLEIQVLDDSTDETTAIATRAVARWREAGIDIVLLHRTDRTGYKAGALAVGLAVAKGGLLAIFDADFVPTPDFLRRAVPHFADPRIGLVQGRWTHLNAGYSLLTRIQGLLLDGHFLIEHFARNRAGCFFNFNGTAGIWRRRAIEDGGGWTHDTLTEDLDLSYRSQLAGWKFLFLPDLAVPAELPVDVNGFKNQQHRWAKGSVQTGRKLLGRLLTHPGLPLKVRLEAFVHLTNNLSYLLMVVLSLLVFPAMLLRREANEWEVLALDLPIFLGATFSVIVFYLAAQIAAGAGWRRALRYLPALLGLGIGLSVNNARAVASGLVSRGGTFVRTPKYRIEGGRRGDWLGLRYRAGKNVSFLVEGLLAAYFAVAFVLAVRWRMWAALPFLYLFLQGYSYMFLLSVVPGLGRSSGGTGPAPGAAS